MNTAQFNKQNKGFTLIELLIVIAIIAVLAVIGITVYSNLQSGSRDSRRIADIESIAKAMEITKQPSSSSSYYTQISETAFAQNAIPKDPITGQPYCMATAIVGQTLPGNPTTSWTTGTCTNAQIGATGYAAVPTTNGYFPTADITGTALTSSSQIIGFRVCASTEKQGIKCIGNQQ